MKLFRKKDFTISAPGISSIQTLTIGGVKQRILIQSENPNNPVLLFIHGGPSMPVPGVSNRGIDYALVTTTNELVKHFTVVFWDQRGTGKSYSKHISHETMCLTQFVQDACDVTDYLRNQFNQSKIHLLAHSWGTVIGLKLVSQNSDKFHTYTAFSQITNWVENDKLSYKWLLEKAKEANDHRALHELVSVGEPPYTESFKQWAVIRKWQFQYKTMFYDAKDKKSASFSSGANIMLRSPDYSLIDVYNSLIRGFKLSYTEQLIHDINTFDFFTEVPSIEIPVMFIHGSKEKHVMPELIARYYELLDAPKGKMLEWSERSSHAFHLDDARKNEQRIIQFLAAHSK